MYYKEGLIHIHVPKTAGTSIRGMLKSQLTEVDHDPHFTCSDYKTVFDLTDHIFTVVRNPFDRVVSFYHWIQSGGPDKNIPRVKKSLGVSFEEFVDIFLEDFEPQHYFWEGCDPYFIRFDRLKEDLEEYFRSIGLTIKVDLPHIFKTNHKHWSRYFSPPLQEKILLYEKPAFDILAELNNL